MRNNILYMTYNNKKHVNPPKKVNIQYVSCSPQQSLPGLNTSW